jgi:hypothetical protein
MGAGGTYWRTAAEPEKDGDSWSAVLRMDGREPHATGPQIVVTATAWQESVRAQHLGHGPAPVFEVGHVTTIIDYEVLGPDGRAIARQREVDPDVYAYVPEDGMATIDSARRHAEEVVRTLEPFQLEWDGSLDSLARMNPDLDDLLDDCSPTATYDWLDVPDDSLLSVKRQVRAGNREQWAIIERDGAIIVQQAHSEDGSWREAGWFATIGDAMAGTPELCTLHTGTSTFFDLDDEADLGEHELAALLDLCPDEGDDDPADWTDSELVACSWNSFEIWPWAAELPLIRRLATINSFEVCGIVHAGNCFPVLANEDGLVPRYVPVTAGTRPRSGVSLPGWDSGSILAVLAPGLACSAPWGEGEDGIFLVDYPEQGPAEEIAAAIAGWLKSITHDFWAALVLEPLGPDGTLDDEGRAAWENGEHALVDPILRVPDDVRPLLRAALTGISEAYARCAEARADPTGYVAQALLASRLPDLHSGDWIQGLEGWRAAAEDHSQLAGLQSRTFARASAVTAAAYPRGAQLTGAQLTVFLGRCALAAVGSTQPDDRPHAVVTSYIRRGTTFWLPMVAGTAPERNLQANPWLTLTVIDGDHGGYIGVQVEGPAETIPTEDVPPDVRAAVGTWVRAWLRLTATRLLSHASGDARRQAQHATHTSSS